MKVYSWPETEACRGVNEVISCIKHYIENYIPNTVWKLVVFTDGCCGQNHNHTLVQYLSSLVINERFDEVIHRLPIRGHRCLSCDRKFCGDRKKSREGMKPLKRTKIGRQSLTYIIKYWFPEHISNVFSRIVMKLNTRVLVWKTVCRQGSHLFWDVFLKDFLRTFKG